MLFKLLVATVLLGVPVAAGSANCDAQTFTKCQHVFDASINVHNTSDWSNPGALAISIQNVYIAGTYKEHHGLVAVCNGYNLMLNCLNNAGINVETCFDPMFMLKNDKKIEQAYPYAMLMKMLSFQCGAGFYPAMDNWQCIQSVYKNKNATLEQTIYQFLLNTQNDPMQACEYTKQGLLSYQKAFSMCANPAVSYYGCESFRQFVSVQYSICQDTCQVDFWAYHHRNDTKLATEEKVKLA
uniref:FZ domain-containing protein n=1 Tax=Steinernema glaseri TaxID=37863 RepID=A0A1I8A1V2_9BILA